MGSGGFIPGGYTGNTWNLGGPQGSTNIWPGSGMPTSGGSSKGSNPVTMSNLPDIGFGFWGGGQPRHEMLQDGSDIFGGGGNFNAGGFNGTGLSGTWASSGFGVRNGPSSGFNFFNPSTGAYSPNSFSAFPANGVGSVPVSGVGNPSMPFSFGNGGSGSGFPSFPSVNPKDLDKIYGKGVGNALAQFLSSGAGFNPGVVQALFNQAAPIEARTLSKMQTMFGDQGAAYSSTAAIGYGDFESQFNAALEGIVAQEYQQAVQNYLNVLMGVKGDAKESHAQGTSLLSIASEIANSIIPFFG